MAGDTGKTWARWINGAILLGFVGYGGFLRWYGSDASLYDTEIASRQRAGESAWYLLKHAGTPLHDLLVKFCLIFGDTEAALRLPSLLAGLLTILAAYGFLRYLHSRTAGLVAAALVTFNPYLIHLSQYASSDALLALCALMAVWCLVVILEHRTWYAWIGLLLFAALAVSPNATFWPALLCMALAGMVVLAFRRGAGSVLWRVALVVVLAACAVAGPAMLIGRGHDPSATYQFDTRFMDSARLAPTASDGERPQGGGRVEKDAETQAVRYRLTGYDIVEYLKRFFWNLTPWGWAGLVVVAAWGIFDLLYRAPAAAFVVGAGFLAGPAVSYLFTANHPYHFRDFSFLAILATVLVAAGVCVLPRFVSRVLGAPRGIRLWRRVPHEPFGRTVTAANVLYPAIVLALAVPAAPYINDAFQSYPVYGYLPLDRGPVNGAPVHDWQGVFETVAPTAREDDVFLFIGPAYNFGPRYANYYLGRLRGWGVEGGGPELRAGTPSPELLKELAHRHPHSNLWFIGTLQQRVKDFEPMLKTAGAEHRDFMQRNRVDGLRLYHLGSPATNLAVNSDFETGWPAEMPAGMALDPVYPYAGSKSLRISAHQSAAPDAETSASFVQVRVAPESYRLRNNGFEAWYDGEPPGWHWNAAAGAVMASTPEGFQGTTGLLLPPVEETAMLVQSIPVGLAPGRTLEVQAIAQSDTPNNLHLAVRYSGPGYQVSHQDSHPGNGKWILLKAALDIPADADPNSITMEIWRTPGGAGDAIVDNVEMRIKDLGGRLDPDKTYVASLMVRTANLRDARDSTRVPVGKVRLAWKNSAGEMGRRELFSFRDGADWRMVHGTFRPGLDLPADVEELYLEAGIEGGRGTIWIDNVQVEEGTQPTPHTRTFRLPLDEALGGVDLAPFAVDVPW